jgi:hypothetical protein
MTFRCTVDDQWYVFSEWKLGSWATENVDGRLRAPQRLDEAILGY